MPSFSVIMKALIQLGPHPLALNALYRFGLRAGHFQRMDERYLKNKQPLPAHYFLFTLPGREQLETVLGQNGLQILFDEADEIVNGKFRMFGGEPVDIKLTGDWPQVHWSLFEIGKAKFEGDIKFIWEPARFGWAFTLGRAYSMTQNEKYAEAFWKYFEIFDVSNPPYLGLHWMNGQEVALRMLAFVWAAQVFETATASSAERRGRLIQSIHAHAARIPPTLIYARSQNNNHLVTEAAALYTAGLFFDNRIWRALGWRWLNWSFQHQISGYGEYIQHSTNYQRVMMQAALWIHAVKKDDWPHATVQALTRAAHWLFSMIDPASGRTPNLGANDGALILPLSSTPFNDFRPTVQAAARAFLRMGLPAGVWNEFSLWLGLRASDQTFESDAYLSDHLRGKNSWAYLRASRFKSRLSHMDQLHLDLWWHGLNVAQDAGTYSYSAAPPWDNPLVSTRVHNTVTVDGRGQMTRSGKFLMLDWADAYSKSEIPTDENVIGQASAYHRAYRNPDVLHERRVSVNRDEKWTVLDRFVFETITKKYNPFHAGEPHLFRIQWLLPDWEWEVAPTPVDEIDAIGYDLHLLSPHGRVIVRLWLDYFFAATFEDKFKIGLARTGESLWGNADVQPIDGWVSPTYGTKIPALSFSMTFAHSAPPGCACVTEFIFPK